MTGRLTRDDAYFIRRRNSCACCSRRLRAVSSIWSERGHTEHARELYATYHADHMRLYGTDLAALSALSEPEHVLEDPIARKFLDNKASLRRAVFV